MMFGQVQVVVVVVVAVVVVVFVCFACTNVSRLPQIDERWFNYSSAGAYPVNDADLQTGWYSTLYNGRTYRLADSSIQWDLGKCGTFYPIYLKGTHRNISQITNMSVEARV
ncbi:hypothetical protein DPMN_074935 [Dreissena polymorpha]|uniref:Uncharacterized protein n=1 Tax=Dreissena polymorpha TaxID=45954 RepID=A0A9D3YKR6_DREPO|nr:hypothetical protein DPMN_074935 [Dreissena polymorpha]